MFAVLAKTGLYEDDRLLVSLDHTFDVMIPNFLGYNLLAENQSDRKEVG